MSCLENPGRTSSPTEHVTVARRVSLHAASSGWLWLFPVACVCAVGYSVSAPQRAVAGALVSYSVESAVCGAPGRVSDWGRFFLGACEVLRVSLCRVILRPSSTHTRLAHMSILSVIVTIVSATTPITGGTDGVIVIGASGTEATPFIPRREYYVDDIAPRHMACLRAVPAHARPEEWLPLRLTPSSYAAAHYRQRFVGRRKAIKRSGPHEEYG